MKSKYDSSPLACRKNDTDAGTSPAFRPATGSRKLVVGLASLVWAAWLLAASGCGNSDGQQNAQAQAPARGPANGGAAPAQPAIPVAVEKAKTGAISSYYTATATLAAENEAEVLARVSGVVKALGCEEGDIVDTGAVLLTIDNDEYQYRLSQAEALTANLRSRFARLEEMQKRELVSAEEYEGLKNDLKSAEAAEGLARLTLSYTQVTAPFRGRVVNRLVDVGQNVNVGTQLFLLSDFEPLLARVHVPAKEFKKIRPEQPVVLILESGDYRLTGRIKLVSPVIDPTSGTIKVTVEIPKCPEGVRPGDFAEVRIVTERRTGSTLVPAIALVTDRGEQVVYVAADSTAERRVVEVGFQDDQNVEIVNGVAPEENIIVKGQRSLKHGSLIKILEGGERAADSLQAAREGS